MAIRHGTIIISFWNSARPEKETLHTKCADYKSELKPVIKPRIPKIMNMKGKPIIVTPISTEDLLVSSFGAKLCRKARCYYIQITNSCENLKILGNSSLHSA